MESETINEHEWFFLYWIAINTKLNKTSITTPELIKQINHKAESISQQTISRRIIHLEKRGFISRTFNKKGGELHLTQKGIDALNNVYHELHILLEYQDVMTGNVASGMGEGAYYIQNPHYLEQFSQKLHFKPYFGTFNLQLTPQTYELFLHQINNFKPVEIEGFINKERTYGNVYCYKADLWKGTDIENKVSCAVLKILRTSHKPNVVEIIAEKFLREYFKVEDNDEINFRLISNNC